MKATRTRRKIKCVSKLDECEWNFSDSARVPDEELMACCYWEYARESNSIRGSVEIAKSVYANQGIPQPESKEREALRSAADKAFGMLTQTGFDNLFWVGLPFPEPWQLVDETERKKWAHFCPKIPTPVKFPPFQVTGDLFVASMLHGEAKKTHEARLALYRRLSQIDRGVANLPEAAELRKKLSEQERHSTPVVVQGMGGVDSFVAQINWREFSKKEIKKCFSKWVDDYSCPIAQPSERGRPMDWRARLERLGLLRLRRCFTFGDAKPFMQKLYPPCLSTQSQPPRKFNDKGECNREANNAVDDFHALFPFLDSAEKPHSWPMK